MKRTVFFSGLKRSGNHAVINWILSNNIRIKHINNAFAINKEIERPGYYALPVSYYGLLYQRLSKSNAIRAALSGNVIISFEDYPLEFSFFKRNPRNVQRVVVVRSARNVFASRIRYGFKTEALAFPRSMNPVMHRAMDVWIDHSRALRSRAGDSNFVGIYFDLWISSLEYRRQIARLLGFEEKIAPGPERADFAGGSSFEGLMPVNGGRDTLLARDLALTMEERILLDRVLSDPEFSAEDSALSDHFQSTK